MADILGARVFPYETAIWQVISRLLLESPSNLHNLLI